MIEADILKILKSVLGKHVYPLVIPEKVKDCPRSTYQVISDIPVNSLRGYSGLRQYRLQTNIYHESHLKCKNLADAVLESLDSAGLGVVVNEIIDGFEPDTLLFVKIVDFSVNA